MSAVDIRIDELLPGLPLFDALNPEEIRRIAMGTQLLRVPRGQVLFHQGDPCNGFHVVIYGEVKLAVALPSGSEKVVEIIGHGGSFGEALMFMNRPYIVYAQAVADSLLLYVSKAAVSREIEQHPGFARKLLAGLGKRMKSLIQDVEAYSLQSGMQRVIGFLLSDEHTYPCQCGRVKVRLPASKGTIASRLNLSQASFSRMLQALSGEGLIHVQGRDVQILDIERLRDYQGSEE